MTSNLNPAVLSPDTYDKMLPPGGYRIDLMARKSFMLAGGTGNRVKDREAGMRRKQKLRNRKRSSISKMEAEKKGLLSK